MLEFRMFPRPEIPISALFSIFFMTSCATVFAPPAHHWPPAPDGYFMHVGSFLQVTGTGKSSNRAEGRDKAIVDAWDRLLKYIHHLPLSGYGYVKVKAAEDPYFADRLEKFVYSAKVIETQYSGDTAAVVIRIGKTQINNILETQFQ